MESENIPETKTSPLEGEKLCSTSGCKLAEKGSGGGRKVQTVRNIGGIQVDETSFMWMNMRGYLVSMFKKKIHL